MAEKSKFEVVSNTPKDALDIESLWIDTSLGDALTETHLHKIPVDKPRDFFRVHPAETYRRRTEIYAHRTEDMIETEYYILGPAMRGQLQEARPCVLATCIYRDGSPRIWPLMLPREDERDFIAWSSARSSARAAIHRWVKLVWVKRSYQTRDAQPGYAPEPDWGKLPPFNDLVTAAFGPHGVICDPTHAIYRHLMGAAPTANPDGDDL
jgi:hypothetical protein